VRSGTLPIRSYGKSHKEDAERYLKTEIPESLTPRFLNSPSYWTGVNLKRAVLDDIEGGLADIKTSHDIERSLHSATVVLQGEFVLHQRRGTVSPSLFIGADALLK